MTARCAQSVPTSRARAATVAERSFPQKSRSQAAAPSSPRAAALLAAVVPSCGVRWPPADSDAVTNGCSAERAIPTDASASSTRVAAIWTSVLFESAVRMSDCNSVSGKTSVQGVAANDAPVTELGASNAGGSGTLGTRLVHPRRRAARQRPHERSERGRANDVAHAPGHDALAPVSDSVACAPADRRWNSRSMLTKSIGTNRIATTVASEHPERRPRCPASAAAAAPAPLAMQSGKTAEDERERRHQDRPQAQRAPSSAASTSGCPFSSSPSRTRRSGSRSSRPGRPA